MYKSRITSIIRQRLFTMLTSSNNRVAILMPHIQYNFITMILQVIYLTNSILMIISASRSEGVFLQN